MNAQKKIAFISSNESDIREVKVSVRFGNPSYTDCRNFGICKIDTQLKSDAYFASLLHYANAILQKNEENVFLLFIKKSMHPKTVEIYFGKGIFKVSKRKKVDSEICKKLELLNFQIMPKEYRITSTENYFLIELTA